MTPLADIAVPIAQDHMGWDSGWWPLAAVGMVAMMGLMGWMMWSMMRPGAHRQAPAQDAVELLRQRYARGELSTEDFHERLRTLEAQRGTDAAQS